MALITCYECGVKISDLVIACPHCGAPRRVSSDHDGGAPKQKIAPSKLDLSRRQIWLWIAGIVCLRITSDIALALSFGLEIKGRYKTNLLAGEIFGTFLFVWVVWFIADKIAHVTKKPKPLAKNVLLVATGITLLFVLGEFVWASQAKNPNPNSVSLNPVIAPSVQISQDASIAPTTQPTPTTAMTGASQQTHGTVESKGLIGTPTDEQECIKQYALGPSSIINPELLKEFCQSAFDVTQHPVARARDLCKVMTWGKEPNKDPTDVFRECDDKNPLPACPEKMEFDLYNMRCEVTCDGLHGFAPDPSGKSCYLACPDGSWPMYIGTVKGCNK